MKKVIMAASPSLILNDNENRKRAMLEFLRDKPFWIWDKAEHREAARKAAGPFCCFNHIVGLPELNSVQHPLYDYQQLVIDKLESNKYIWIKKSTGLGLTETWVRYFSYLACRNNDLQGKRICIIAGIRWETSIEIVDRIRALFNKKLDITFEGKRTEIVINGCTISCYPAEHTDSLRGMTDLAYILVDEGDFFSPLEQRNIRDITDRYIAKTAGQVKIIYQSTPNRPDGLFSRMEFENPSIYEKIFLDWTWGYNKIYTPESIKTAMKSPSFKREYALEYYGSALGNVLDHATVQAALELGKEYNPDNPAAIADPFALRCIGIDPAWGSSKFAIVLTQLKTRQYPTGEMDVIEVMLAEQYERPNFADMVQRVIEIMQQYNFFKHDVRSLDMPVFVDQSAAGFLSSLRQAAKLEPRYDLLIEKARRAGFTQPRQIQSILGCIQPKLFSHSENKKMLNHFKQLFDAHMVAINGDKFRDLVSAISSAYSEDGDTLSKQHSAMNDLTDALMISLSWWKLKAAR
jgi:hypothetical protein